MRLAELPQQPARVQHVDVELVHRLRLGGRPLGRSRLYASNAGQYLCGTLASYICSLLRASGRRQRLCGKCGHGRQHLALHQLPVHSGPGGDNDAPLLQVITSIAVSIQRALCTV